MLDCLQPDKEYKKYSDDSNTGKGGNEYVNGISG
jgi:hypothetical protein